MIIIHKPPGITPLQAIQQYKQDHPELAHEIISYAGRLDPMAEGQLLLLIGKEENKQRRHYEHLDKTYEFEILVGFSTDTYDILGMITQSTTEGYNLTNAKNAITSLVGTHTFPYPPYSSKYVHSDLIGDEGHPLYWYAKRNLLHTITIPTQTVIIHHIDVLSEDMRSANDVLNSIEKRLSVVEGNFRQVEILTQWQETLANQSATYPTITCTISCSSGTYIRSIVNTLSEKLHVPMLTFTIKRTAIKLP